MKTRRHINFRIINEVPNKYDLTIEKIKQLRVIDWDALKKFTWFNQAMSKPCWCRLQGCNDLNKPYDDEDEFWIGFYEDGTVDCNFYSYGGMCGYEFPKFYDAKYIENRFDLNVQVNAIRYLNMLLDEKIVALGDEIQISSETSQEQKDG